MAEATDEVVKSLTALSESATKLAESMSAAGVHSFGEASRSAGPKMVDSTPSLTPPGAPPPGGDGETGGDSHLSILKEILEAIKALHNQNKEQKDDDDQEKARPWEATKDAAFGETPSTNLGKFIHRTRGIVNRARKRLGKAFGGMKGAKKAFGGMKGAGGAARGAAAAGEGLAGGGAAAGAAGAAGVAGGVAAGAVIIMAAAVEFGKAVYDFGRAQEKDIRRLANVGGQQAESTALLDAERVMRDIKTAEETGDSSKSLVESLNKLEDKFQPIESLIMNISNSIAGGLMDIVSGILDAVSPIVDALIDIYNALPGRQIEKNKEGKPESNWELLDRMTKQFEKNNSPKWPMNGGQGPRGGGGL